MVPIGRVPIGSVVSLGSVPYAEFLPGRVSRVAMQVQASVVEERLPGHLPKEFLERVAADPDVQDWLISVTQNDLTRVRNLVRRERRICAF